ncbi:MAG TPA: CvpA family protein [Verrucomicrobiae bacterium]|nr:CvpA family protein [Verrucomicrobiae bacterium]
MSFGLADFAAAGYLTWGALKGRRRGLSVELPRFASVTLALVTGAGLARWADHIFEDINKLTGQAAGALGWGGILVGAFYLARQFRAWMGQWITGLLPEETVQKRAGMAAGFLRTLVISSIITICLLHTPLAFLVRDSVMGGLARIVQPVYHVANKPHP